MTMRDSTLRGFLTTVSDKKHGFPRQGFGKLGIIVYEKVSDKVYDNDKGKVYDKSL